MALAWLALPGPRDRRADPLPRGDVRAAAAARAAADGVNARRGDDARAARSPDGRRRERQPRRTTRGSPQPLPVRYSEGDAPATRSAAVPGVITDMRLP